MPLTQVEETALSLPLYRDVIENAARAALRECPYDTVRSLDCAVSQDAVVLSGQVSSYYLKQIAQTIVTRRLNGAARVENRVEVVS
jgi:hypothetical protein